MLALTLTISASTLAGCASLTPSADAPVNLPTLPASLAAACDRPVTLPARDIDRAEVTRLWGRDRVALARCADRHGAVVTYYGDLRQRLGSARK
jgi:hypothetical protein